MLQRLIVAFQARACARLGMPGKALDHLERAATADVGFVCPTTLAPSMSVTQFDHGYWYATDLKHFAKTLIAAFILTCELSNIATMPKPRHSSKGNRERSRLA